jgi:hypothetical protein
MKESNPINEEILKVIMSIYWMKLMIEIFNSWCDTGARLLVSSEISGHTFIEIHQRFERVLGSVSMEERSSDFSEREVQNRKFLVMGKKELQFRKCRLINERSKTHIDQLDGQSTNNAISFSIITGGFPKPIMFYNINPPQEHVGSEASSSSEDG